MGNLFAHIVTIFNKRLWLFFTVLIGLSTIFYLGLSRLQIDDNLYAIFPQGEEFQQFNEIVKENKLNKQAIFSINAEGKDVYELQDCLDSLSQIITIRTDSLVGDFVSYRADNEALVLDHFYNHYSAFLEKEDYELIKAKIRPDSIKESIRRVYAQMTSMSSIFTRKIVAKDPLFIATQDLKSLQPGSSENSIFLEDGVLFLADRSKALMTANIQFELDDNHSNNTANQLLEKLKNQLNAENPDLAFDYFGTFQISYENSRQVKEDTFLTLIISGVLILLLLIIYYRSLLAPIFFVLPAIFSSFAGLGLVGIFQDEIAAISVATSAVLLGIVLDYSFHFFTHYASSGDLKKTVKHLSFPMLVGSFTTIAAFAALLFTDSVVLKNFGIIALCTLSSAAIFTLLFLPTLLKLTGYKLPVVDSRRRKPVSKLITRVSIYAILALTIVFLFKANNISFDADLNNLSYHTEELVQKEELYTGINPSEEKKIYVFTSGESKEESREQNFLLYKKLLSFRRQNGLQELFSVAPYLLPQEEIKNGEEQWGAFWNEYRETTLESIGQEAKNLDFSVNAFVEFEKWTSNSKPDVYPDLIESLGLNHLVYQRDNSEMLTTSIVVNRSKLETLKDEIRTVEGVFIFDVAEMTNELIASVQDDFNYLLIFSSLLVLISLVVIYGRFELALFAFMPMVVSWIWILAIASMLGIDFNFVNIIVATFIFGLGDDFSIFVTDGLLKKYVSNENSLSSYRSAILLSGLTTIIGTGSLYFAAHPAVHSVSLISVIGIGCILLVTLIIQPSLFAFFVTNRTKKRKSPVTLLGLLASIILFSYFFIGCLILNVVMLVVILVPYKKQAKQLWLNFLVSKLAKSTIYLGVHVKKKVINYDKLDFSKPSIIVANHSSFLDILLMIMLNPKVVILVKKWVYNSPIFGFFIRYSGYLYVAEGTEYNVELIRKRVSEGYSIMIFPEGTRSIDGEIKRFHKGAFYLAQELKIDVQPILIVGASYVNPKNDIIIKSGTIVLEVMDRIKVDDAIFSERFGLLTKEVQERMRYRLKEVLEEYFNVNELKSRVLYNYLYKGPVLEWYIRIKWMFERNNYKLYDQLIGERERIYDVGCGYGYLGFYLHYRNPKRKIIALDYDRDKIELAQNSYDKSENLAFKVEDIRKLEIEKADVIFFNDVLHYLSKEEQLKTLKNAHESLNDQGKIFVRDGITDLSDRHNKTKRTERYSTKIINFNKVSGELSFFAAKDIYNFAKENDLKCEMIEQSSSTSNVMFILEKNGK